VLDGETVIVGWGDGTKVSTFTLAVGARDFTLDHTYTRAGTYYLTVEVQDSDGGISNLDYTVAQVGTAAVTGHVLASSVSNPGSINATAIASTQPDDLMQLVKSSAIQLVNQPAVAAPVTPVLPPVGMATPMLDDLGEQWLVLPGGTSPVPQQNGIWFDEE